MKEVVEKSVLGYVGGKDVVKDVAKLYGDASYRTYFRVGMVSGKSFIVMKMPESAASASEEITNYNGAVGEIPYINVADFLNRIGIPVPKIYHYNKEQEVIILEDLGDGLFCTFVVDADDDTKFDHYRRAIDLLLGIQKNANDDGRCIAFKRSFDRTLLNWEFDHFMEYGIEARLKRKIGQDVKKSFIEITRAITDEIIGMRYGFVHRDYQSRNLIISDSKIYVLDFQDALLGPYPYDFVALTRDSYVEISDNLLDRLISYYTERKGLDEGKFKNDYDLVTVQRKLKDAGRFVYIEKVKGNPGYLRHIPRSLTYVKKALKRSPKYIGLYELLKPYVLEWQDD